MLESFVGEEDLFDIPLINAAEPRAKRTPKFASFFEKPNPIVENEESYEYE